jgi:hypothetical protein
MNFKKYIFLVILSLFPIFYAKGSIDISALSSHPIGYIITPYAEVIEIFISNSHVLNELLLKLSTLHPEDVEIYYYDHLQQINAELNLLKIQIQQEINASSYPSKFTLKMKKSFLKALDDFFTMESFKKEYFKNNSDYRSLDWYYILHLSFAAEFNFIDLAALLEISLDENRLNVNGLQEYHAKHFSSGYDLEHLEKVSENNYNLYNTWYLRWLDAYEKGELDIETPEVNIVYDYIIQCFELYREMFETAQFQKYLNTISESLSEDIKQILEMQNGLSKPYRSGEKLTYFTLIKSDLLLRKLLTITYSESGEAQGYMTSDDEDQLSKNVFNKVFEFFKEGIFLLPHIGVLHNSSFLMSLDTPHLYGTDICISAVPFDYRDMHLMHRIWHDCEHIDRIYNAIYKYYKIEDRHFVHAVFKEFLQLLSSNSWEHSTYQTLIEQTVSLYHGSMYPITLNDEFMASVTYLDWPKLNPHLKPLISTEIQEKLTKEWKKIRARVSKEHKNNHIDPYELQPKKIRNPV